MDITTFVIKHRDDALLVGDYNTYRTQLSRQLLAIRKRLSRSTPKTAKYTTKDAITAEQLGQNHEFAHLILLTAERAWAHAMRMKSTHAEDSTGQAISRSIRNHIVSRLNKAAKSAEELVTLLRDQTVTKASDIDVLEARAYLASITGAEEFEKQAEGQRSADAKASKHRWQKCLRGYSEARVIYAALLKETKKDVFREILANTVDPTIRYAAYQAHLPRTIAIATISKKNFPREDPWLVAAVERLDPDALRDEITPTPGKSWASLLSNSG
ncbi:signal recognition particle subunit srp68 [Elasticomyces elasticus]|nr:signal recognition particle subunit srp68 [Elasticomyces elasticus]